MNEPIIRIDLHGMRRDEAQVVIDHALSMINSGTYQIRLIHGFNRGVSLRDMIIYEYRDHPDVIRIAPGENRGITNLIIREL